MPNLIIERGREKGQSVDLNPAAACVVGRDPNSAQFVIADAAASRRHFQLSARNGKWYVSDLGSRNATFVNEEKISREVELTSGDRIQVGETVFTFNDDPKSEDKAAGLQGKEIGGYMILERIGRGGMGTVFKAKQVSLNRLVALKFLSPKLSKDPAFVAKFFAEARAAAQLNHPNVVQVFDVGTLSGVNYFSMEFMEGGCVQDLLTAREDSRLTWQEAMPVIIDSVRGLVFAEKRGIIHRDIKPDNLMLTSEQKVKIGDLGLATSAEGEKEKGIFGTPHFIAPEQAQGKEVTHAADLYSLGATFYRVVAGKTPFTGATVKEILKAQINDPHVPVVQIVPDFPAELSAIIDKLMAKKVEDRYQSATKLLEDLEAFQLAHQIELAGGVRTRKPFLIVIGIVLVALAGVVFWAVTRPKPKPERVVETDPAAVAAREKAEREAEQARAEQRRIEAEAAAASAFNALELRDARLGETITLEEKDDWIALATDFDRFAAENPEATNRGAKATKRATDIRVEIERQETERDTIEKAAKEWWAKTEEPLKAAAGNDRWGDAIRGAAAVLASDEWKQHKDRFPPTAEKWLQGMADECYGFATNENADTLTEAEKALKDGEVQKSIQLVDAWEKKLRAQNLDDPRWTLLADGAKQWREAKAKDVTAQLVTNLTDDKKIFIEAWRRVRHLGPADDGGGPVFNYRFADAARDLRAGVEGRVKTWLYRERAERVAVRLDAAQVAWDAFCKAVAEKQIWGAGDDIKDFPGQDKNAKVTLDPDRPATQAEVYVIVAVGGGTKKTTLQWENLTPEDLFRLFIGPRIDKVPAELALQLAQVFGLLGELNATESLVERARPNLEQIPWLTGELAAMREFDRIWQGANMQPGDQIRYVDQWRKAHYRTDFSILADGRPPEDLRHLFPDEDVERFVRTFGQKN